VDARLDWCMLDGNLKVQGHVRLLQRSGSVVLLEHRLEQGEQRWLLLVGSRL
jgi:hypothetical protein